MGSKRQDRVMEWQLRSLPLAHQGIPNLVTTSTPVHPCMMTHPAPGREAATSRDAAIALSLRRLRAAAGVQRCDERPLDHAPELFSRDRHEGVEQPLLLGLRAAANNDH
jgi:hypothetical protein